MASASIIFQQNADGYTGQNSRDDLVLSLPVTVKNNDNTGVTVWLWTIIDKPVGSTASLVAPGASTTTFTPDLVGTYLIKLTVNNGAAFNQRGAAVKTAKLHFRIPAATETTEFDSSKGWAPAVDFAFKTLDDGYFPPASTSTFQQVYNASTPSSFTLNSGNGTLIITDAQTPLGTNLLEVDAYGGATKYLAVSAASTSVVGKFLQTGGVVGLGTATPGAGYTSLIPDLSVHVLKTVNHNMFLIDTASTSGTDSGLVLYTAASGNDAAVFLDESDGQRFKIALGTIDSDAGRQANTKITIQQDGSVGIGITTPSSLLHVSGTGHFTGAVSLDAGFTSGAAASMSNFKITSLATPTAGTDAVNKSYVDALVGGIGSTLQSAYTASIPATIVLNSSNGPFVLQDAQTPLGSGRTPLFSVDAYGSSSNYMQVYRGGAALHPEAGSNSNQTTGAASGVNYITLWGSAVNDVYAGGYDPSVSKQQLAHYNGTSWSVITTYPGATGDTVNSIFGFAANNLYIGTKSSIGGAGGIWHSTNSGVSWSQQYNTKGVNTIWGPNSTNIYAGVTDTSGVVLFSNGGGSWSAVAGNVGTRFINNIWGSSASEFWVATSDSIWHTTNSGSTFASQFDTNANSFHFQSFGYSVNWQYLYGNSSSDIYAVGYNGGSGYVAHYDGTNWTMQIANYPDIFNSVYSTSANNIFIVGQSTVLYNNGDGAFVPLPQFSSGGTLSGVFAATFNATFVGVSGSTLPSVVRLAPVGGNLSATNIVSVNTVVAQQFIAPVVAGKENTGLRFTAFNNSDQVTNEIAFKYDVSGVMNATSSSNRLFQFNNNGTEVFGLNGNPNNAVFHVPSIGAFTSGSTIWSWNSTTFTTLGVHAQGSLAVDSYATIGGTLGVTSNATIGGVLQVDGYAVIDGTISVDGYIIDPGNTPPNAGDVLLYSGTAFVPGTLNIPIISDNTNLLLTTTSPTNVISYTPPTDGDFVVYVYYRVVTATTTLTINVTWTDGSGSQTFNALPATAESVGSYSIAPLYITASSSAPIVIQATAATANQVYISGTSMSLYSSLNSDAGTVPAVAEEADAFDYQVTTTSPTNVLAFTPPSNENFFVYIYYRVVTATTNVTIDLTWNDNSGSQTLNILPIAAKTVGSYSVAPVYIQAITSAPIIVKVTAGTANNVYVSATIMMV